MYIYIYYVCAHPLHGQYAPPTPQTPNTKIKWFWKTLKKSRPSLHFAKCY